MTAPLTGSDELLTGTPTVLEVGTSDLTISNVGITSDEWILDGFPVSKARAVEFTVAGGVAGTTYALRVTAGTDATGPQTLIRDLELRVN